MTGRRAGALASKALGAAGLALGAALAVLPLVSPSPYLSHLFATFWLWAAMSQAWNLVGGYAGQFSLGHAAFFGAGAYAAALAWTNGLGAAAGTALAGLAGAVLALPVGWLCFRLRGAYFVLSTLAAAEVVRLCALNLRGITGGAVGILLPPLSGGQRAACALGLALFGLATLTSALVRGARLGYRLRALREDEDAAEAAGVPALKSKLWALSLSGGLCGLAGALFCAQTSYIDPGSVFSLADVSIPAALGALLGGWGALWGPPAGAGGVVLVAEAMRVLLGRAHGLAYGLLLVLTVLLVPQGFCGLLAARRRAAGGEAGAGRP
ncbi:MAG: branched-chain amino acid ABC transporter permease [Acetobacteraceae bacterium]|nr:branched-chain amino acid ABC transporter permease [Acetobacteraceae bacterium]